MERLGLLNKKDEYVEETKLRKKEERAGKIKNVIGVDINQASIAEAKEYIAPNNSKVCFLCADVEKIDFENKLNDIKNLRGIDKFDVIVLSMILLHLEEPVKLLVMLRSHLNVGGIIIVRDIDDGFNIAYPDPKGLFQKAIEICQYNMLGGYRYSGRQIANIIYSGGYKEINLLKQGISTPGLSMSQRTRLFNVYFGFIKLDCDALYNRLNSITPLSEDHPYAVNKKWFDENYSKLQAEFNSDGFFFNCGFMLFTAKKTE